MERFYLRKSIDTTVSKSDCIGTVCHKLTAETYDAMGNRSTFTRSGANPSAVTYTANSANQYTTVTGLTAPPVHDANGNLTSQNGITYSWDSENRLLRTSDGTTQNTYTYHGQHRRVSKKTFVGNRLTASTHFIYDGWNVIEEWTTDLQSPTTTLAKTHTWGTDLSGTLQGAGGVGGLLLITDHSALGTSAYHFHYDGNGNVTEITDLTGTPVASYRYDAFGNTLVATGSYAEENKYRFSTKPLDAEITTAPLYYYGYRYYDPQTGRWPSRDPIGENGGINLYGFVGNNGVNHWDYLGKCTLRRRISGPEIAACGVGANIGGGFLIQSDRHFVGSVGVTGFERRGRVIRARKIQGDRQFV